jgi:hypothetical protein
MKLNGDGEDNIKMVLKDVGFEGVDWVHLDRIGGNGGLL